MSLLPDDPRIIEESTEESERFFNDGQYVHFMGVLNSFDPGFRLLIEFVEMTFYTPSTQRNTLFMLHILRPTEDGPCFGIVSIPTSERKNIEDHIGDFGLAAVAGLPKSMILRGIAYAFPFPDRKEGCYMLVSKPNG